MNTKLLESKGFTAKSLGGSFTIYVLGTNGIMKGANGKPYIVDANTINRLGNKDGYESTEEAIKAFDGIPNRSRVTVYENGMVESDGAADFFGRALGLK